LINHIPGCKRVEDVEKVEKVEKVKKVEDCKTARPNDHKTALLQNKEF
jgi:hypothetical protein